jgi:hypothetical protein
MPDKTEWHPCNQRQGFCPLMDERVKFPGEKGYGFFAFVVVNYCDPENKQSREEVQGVMYKSDQKDRGLMMNCCPFCGAKIDWFRDKKEQENDRCVV